MENYFKTSIKCKFNKQFAQMSEVSVFFYLLAPSKDHNAY